MHDPTFRHRSCYSRHCTLHLVILPIALLRQHSLLRPTIAFALIRSAPYDPPLCFRLVSHSHPESNVDQVTEVIASSSPLRALLCYAHLTPTSPSSTHPHLVYESRQRIPFHELYIVPIPYHVNSYRFHIHFAVGLSRVYRPQIVYHTRSIAKNVATTPEDGASRLRAEDYNRFS